ncbi:hypothetical protein D3C85_1233400 [compost metagenome]
MISRQRQHFLEVFGGQSIIACIERRSARQIQLELSRQARALRVDLMRIRQAAQLFHQRLLFCRQP